MPGASLCAAACCSASAAGRELRLCGSGFSQALHAKPCTVLPPSHHRHFLDCRACPPLVSTRGQVLPWHRHFYCPCISSFCLQELVAIHMLVHLMNVNSEQTIGMHSRLLTIPVHYRAAWPPLAICFIATHAPHHP